MRNITYYLKSVAIVTALTAFATSCDKTEGGSNNTENKGTLVSITASTQVPDTKVSYEEGINKMTVKWATNDAFKLYATDGAPKGDFTLDSSDDGKTSGTFTGTASEDTYKALFPAPTGADATTTVWDDLRVNYTGQTQNGSSAAHMAPYNYMVATGVSVSSSNAATATFKHMGCILQFTITMPSGYDPNKNGQPVSLIITAPGMSSDIKPSAASTAGTPVSSQTLKLSGLALDATNKTFTAYLMSAPFTVPANGKLSISVACEKGSQGKFYGYSHSFTAEKQYIAGQRYKFDLSGSTITTQVVSAGEDYVAIDGVRWATGNIVKVANQTPNKLSFANTANQQGLVFKWGSLIGLNMVGENFDQTSPTSSIAFVPGEYTTSIADWVGIPSEGGDSEDSQAKDSFIALYKGTGYKASEGTGDICRYMSAQGWLKGNWRMPTSAEFDKLNAKGANRWPTTTWSVVSPFDVNGQDVISQGCFFGAGATGVKTTTDMKTPPLILTCWGVSQPQQWYVGQRG